MGGDYSRKTFDPRKNYSQVLMQQGRVVLDADWNEESDINDRRWRSGMVDTIGRAAVPTETENGFKIELSSGNLLIHPGRMYVNGLLAKNYGEAPISFDPVLDEEHGTLPISFDNQPYLPVAPALPSNKPYIVYLDVWRRGVNHVKDPDIVEPAVGFYTATRMQTVWQVKIHELDDVGDIDCDDEPEEWKALIEPSAARLSTSITSEPSDSDPCLSPSPSGGYRGLENRLYRVEIHEGGNFGGAKFKWARHNASVETEVTAIDGTKITVAQSKWDDERRFNPGDWAEVTDDAREFSGQPGEMRQIESVDVATNTITLNSPLPATDFPTSGSEHLTDPTRHTRIRRWDQKLGVDSDGLLDVNELPIHLEHGIEITFSKAPDLPDGEFKAGDYWLFHARAADRSMKILNYAPPQGILHHYAKLAVVKPAGIVIDCRPPWPPQTGGGDCCAVTVGDGDRSHGDFDSIAEALLGLPAEAGTICLLPGKYLLREPIDLSNVTGIHFKGSGSVSQLYVADPFEGKAAFILSGAKEVSFENFAIFNRTAESVWSCEETEKLAIKNMVVSTTLVKGMHAVLNIEGDQCHHWQIQNNAFSGPLAIAGKLLSDSIIFRNSFQGTYGGIKLVDILRTVIEGNRFSALHKDLIEELEFNVADIRTNDAVRKMLFKNIFLRPFLLPKRSEIVPDFVGIDVSVAFETVIIGNHFQGSVGLNCEIFENGKIHSNDFITRLTGASLGLVKNLRFSENRIGLKRDGQNQETAVQCRLGLAILGDAVDCRIVDNFFANVQEGIAFESDLEGKNAIVRDFAVNIFTVDNMNQAMAKTILADSKARIKQRHDNLQLLASTYFQIGKCERILIQGNQIDAIQTAIEWSGTKNIIDFRIVNNSFRGCQDPAIQIEPDASISFTGDPVDTKVRLIEKNRFEIYSAAVRATIGAVRIEKNDIRIKAPPKVLAPSKEILQAAAENVYNLAPLTEAVKKDDIPMMRMVDAVARNAIQKNSSGIDNRGFSRNLSDAVLENYETGKGDVWADNAFVMKTIGDIEEPDLIAQLMNTNLHKLIGSTEGYAVNLSGNQNRSVHNRIHSDNTQHTGGIVFHALSGEVRDNEVSVPGTALLLSGKAGVSSARQGVEVIRNSLEVFGIPGDKQAVYALAMPSLSPGRTSISDNRFIGHIMIGGDPISAHGITNKDKFAKFDMITNYHAIKYDMSTYINAAHDKVFSVQSGGSDPFSPPSILFPTWLTAPHINRPVIQFSNNRVIKGWLGIFQAISGAYWTESLLKKLEKKALVANLSNNILDYGGSVVGYDVILVGNHSQFALKYRVGRKAEAVANMPEARSF